MSKQFAHILSPEEIKVGMTVWVEVHSGGVKELKFYGARPFGFRHVCVFSDGYEWNAGAYGYRWRCWSAKPSERERSKPWKGKDYGN